MEKYKFKLYIVENKGVSEQMVEQLTHIFQHALKEEYTLEIIDVLKNPEQALNANVLATPTLVLEAPLPEKRIVGNITNEKSVLWALKLVI